MDAEEKVTALKKAYADIILNISKEAAMRVMSSERRAARAQHELKVAKAEALRTLMRLKQMMDSKITHVEIASQNQQKKIDVLEAQLDEAEDIVKDLREELGEARAEQERLKKDSLQHSNEPTSTCSIEMETGILDSYKSSKSLHPNSQEKHYDVTMPYSSQRNEYCMFNSEILCTCSSYIRSRDLTSIILRDKESGLYRNGCTQRIRACERNLLDKPLCLSGETDKVNDEKNSREQREQEESEDTSKTQASGAKTLSELERKLLAGNKLSNSRSFRRENKRATGVRKTIAPLSGKHVPVLVKETTPVLSQVKNETQTHLRFEKNSRKQTNLVEICGGSILQKDEELNEKMVPFEEEAGFAENMLSPDCKIDVEKIDVSSNGLEPNSSNAANELDSQSVGKRMIKYTYQRKRKRECPSRSKMISMPATEKRIGVKQNDDQNLEKSKTKESSRDSRRLTQVARQLISLSEKKWWH